ncbi:MAG: hypothetical protein RMJ87_02990 [Cytophagales bacterium]|nr:hypothetical protein [Bernardetiaceae bacterium]MDW8203972.1 hypothetical protein [Cytophagales bacterium]
MTMSDLKKQIKNYLMASVEGDILNKELFASLRQAAYDLGLSEADLQCLIGIAQEELTAEKKHIQQPNEHPDLAPLKEEKLQIHEPNLEESPAHESAIYDKPLHLLADLNCESHMSDKQTPHPTPSSPERVSLYYLEDSKSKSAANMLINKKILPLLLLVFLLVAAGIGAFFWHQHQRAANGTLTNYLQTTTVASDSKLVKANIAGKYQGTVTYRKTEEPITVEIYDIQKAVNQRFLFQFRGELVQRKQAIQGFGEVEFTDNTIYLGHRLMGDAVLVTNPDGSIAIRGTDFQLVKKP